MTAQTAIKTPQENPKRTIAILHRIKRTASGEARPTLLRITPDQGGGSGVDLKLETEQNELDFILGRYPVRMRKAGAADTIPDHPEHQLTFSEYDPEKHGIVPDHHKVVRGKKTFILTEVPDVLEGLKESDKVLMPLGGSGDYLAFAASVQAEKVGAVVLRIPPRQIKEERDRLQSVGPLDNFDNLEILPRLHRNNPDYFYPVTIRERDMIQARELFRAREHTQRDRKSCAMRVRQLAIGEIFVKADGLFPQGSIEKQFDEIQGDDGILKLIAKREKELEADLGKVLPRIPVYEKVFGPIEGVGPVIAAGIICAVGDIRLFVRSGGNLRHRAGKLKKFCGVAPENGKLPRKTTGKSLGFNPQVRQALFKFGDQMNKRPGSEWGMRLAENKAHYVKKFPFETLVVKPSEEYAGEYLIDGEVCRKLGTRYEIKVMGEWHRVAGKRKHFKGHLHKMAIWKTLTEFVEHLYDEWTRLEGIIPGQGEAQAAA